LKARVKLGGVKRKDKFKKEISRGHAMSLQKESSRKADGYFS